MKIRWNALYELSYPAPDQPVEVAGITLVPAPFAKAPEGSSLTEQRRHKGGCVHTYQFETRSTGNPESIRQRQGVYENLVKEAREKANERWLDLVLLMALTTEPAIVEPPKLIVEEAEAGIPDEGESIYVGATMRPIDRQGKREAIGTLAEPYLAFKDLPIAVQTLLQRACIWIHRARLENAEGDDRLIYIWIAFNCLYNAVSDRLSLGSRPSEKMRINAFATQFPFGQCDLRISRLKTIARNVQVVDRSGVDLSEQLMVLEDTDGLVDVTSVALTFIYGLRNDLFHAGHSYIDASRHKAHSAAGGVLSEYVLCSLPLVIRFLSARCEAE